MTLKVTGTTENSVTLEDKSYTFVKEIKSGSNTFVKLSKDQH